MVRKKNLAVAGILVAVGAFILFLVTHSEEDNIRNQFKRLCEIGTRKSGENPLILASRVSQIKELFDRQCHIDFPSHSISKKFSHQELVSLALNVLYWYDTLESSFYDLSIHISNSIAQVVLTAKLTGKLRSGENVKDIQEVKCILLKIDGEWLFSEIYEVDVLER